MHIPKRLIRLAKDRALSSFSSLAEQTVVEADTMTTRGMAEAGPEESRNLSTVRTFLRGEARTLRTRMDRHFAGFLERAMVTMHTDLRGSALQEINYQTLTLIDDDVVTRQIEVDRMVSRLRDAEPIALGRVNLTIAVMHNDSEARERENPFRPYLLARSLYEALRELMWEEAQSKLLFDTLSVAMAHRLPGFYAGIVEVFEAGGITARLTARPSAMSRSERDRLAWQRAAQQMAGNIDPSGLSGFSGLPNLAGLSGLQGFAGLPDLSGLSGIAGLSGAPGSHGTGGSGRSSEPAVPAPKYEAPLNEEQALQARLMPRLLRLKDIQAGSAEGALAGKGQDLIDVVWNIFHQPKGTRSTRTLSTIRLDGERAPLDSTLLELQQGVGAGEEAPAPLALRDLAGETSADERRTMDVVALLFESMIHDELLGAGMHRQLARLYLPFVRAALIEPDLLHNAGHPVRRLVDRIGSVAVGLANDAAALPALEAELEGIVGAVLDLFDDDMHIFIDAERALDAFVSTQLVVTSPRIGPCIEAISEAEAASTRLAGAGAALSAALQPLQIDPRLADFILGTWARVLSHTENGSAASIALLPELLWSAQEKTTPEDRSAMMRMLPGLVKQVREGMAEIALPEAPSKAAFDRLVAVHMDVLGNKQEAARNRMTLEQFREHFQGFTIDSKVAPEDGREGWVGKFELEAALGQHQVEATLHAKAANRLPQTSDADWLAWARPGTAFEIRIEEKYRPALLCTVSSGGCAYLFTIAGEEAPVIYLRAPLLEAFEHWILRPLEYAPLYDRAVESLMTGAESLSV
ncbi:MAG: DUF1631 family protein [Pseudomonadota bacterium]